MEQDDALAGKKRRVMQAQSGRTFRSLGVLAYSPTMEAKIAALPTFTLYRKPLQHADGTFVFMLGIDRLGGTSGLG